MALIVPFAAQVYRAAEEFSHDAVIIGGAQASERLLGNVRKCYSDSSSRMRAISASVGSVSGGP